MKKEFRISISRLCLVAVLMFGLSVAWSVTDPRQITGDRLTGGCDYCNAFPGSSKCLSVGGKCIATRLSCARDENGSGICDRCPVLTSCYPCKNIAYCVNQANEVCYGG